MEGIKAGRDVNISDSNVSINQSQEAPKLLEMCTVEELLKEKEYRQKMLQDEIKRKRKKLLLS